MNVTVAQSRAARAMLAWSSWMTSPTAPAYIAIHQANGNDARERDEAALEAGG